MSVLGKCRRAWPRLFFARGFSRRVWLGALLLTTTPGGAANIETTLTTDEKRELQREGRLVVDLLQNLHYAGRQFHQLEAKEIIDRFVDTLDPDKLVFTQADVEFIHRRFDRSLKTVYLLKGDFQPAFEIYNLLTERTEVRQRWIDRRLQGAFDFTTDESESFDAASAVRPAGAAEADTRWERRLKALVLASRLSGREPEAAVSEVRREFDRWSKQVLSRSAIEVRARFLEDLIGLFDPHSGYFSSEHAGEFEILMRGAVAGVGLDVRMDAGRCLVAGLLPAGPAEVQGELAPGDELLALAEADGAWNELGGKRLEAITAWLRGPAGVRLRVAYRAGPDAARKEISLVRQQVTLAGGRARGGVAEVPRETELPRRVGWVELPDFYASGAGADASSATRDVRELIEQMEPARLDGLVIDLRRNPGGAMTEAVALTGLFVPGGKVLAVRGADGVVVDQIAAEGLAIYGGPLVVLVSRESASASEIFAGALTHHRRALVVGDPRTYGKGTAQSFIDLNASPARGTSARLRWGMLRVTGQRFYFPDGHSPQGRGALADFTVAPHDDPNAKYEEDLPHALAPDSIPPREPRPAEDAPGALSAARVAQLRKRSSQRAATMPEFAWRQRGHALALRAATQREFSLNLVRREEERATLEQERAAVQRELIALAPAIEYRVRPVEIAAVRVARRAHEALVRERRPEGGAAGAGWLGAGRLYRENPGGGPLREVPLGRFEFHRLAESAPVLAAAFTAGSGYAVSADDLAAALREASWLENRTVDTVAACFNRFGGDAADAARVRRGLESVLSAMTDLDPGLFEERPMIDVGWRESLRLAADWAELAAGSPP